MALVSKHICANGLTILVGEMRHVPKVSMQLWYAIGSAHEQPGKHGIAHLLEHMIFKGTTTLSESDINVMMHRLSGSTNAFTSPDYTGYMFELPTQHWTSALRLAADCMQNCTIAQEPFNSELRAVVQELKMYRDDYDSALIETIMRQIFGKHPYAVPVIGHKQELLQLGIEDLRSFYKRYYNPCNATVIVIGDIARDKAIQEVEHYFSSLNPSGHTAPQLVPWQPHGVRETIIYRDIQQPSFLFAYVLPGLKSGTYVRNQVLAGLLGSGRSSILHKRLVDELQLVTSLDCYTHDLFEHALVCIQCTPKRASDCERIKNEVLGACSEILGKGVAHSAVQRVTKRVLHDLLIATESANSYATVLGNFFLATQDAAVLEHLVQFDDKQLSDLVMADAHEYLQPAGLYTCYLYPMDEPRKKVWAIEQEKDDELDVFMLSKCERTEKVACADVATRVTVRSAKSLAYPKSTTISLQNGLGVHWYGTSRPAPISLLLQLPTGYLHDPKGYEGLHAFMSALLLEGSERYPGALLAQEIERLGIRIATAPGLISMRCLSTDLERGLQLLTELVQYATFEATAIEKVRAFVKSDIQEYWDTPIEFVDDLIRRHLYPGHPLGRPRIGTLESIDRIHREQLLKSYRSLVSPRGAHLIMAGNVPDDLPQLLEQTIGQWQGPEVPMLILPPPTPITREEITYVINRDQVVLSFAGHSVQRMHESYDALFMFDQLFSGGVLGSMSSRLLALREQSGLFYAIGGTLVAEADEHHGMVLIKTLVSKDMLDLAQRAIEQVIESAPATITQDECIQARNALINSFSDYFETHEHMAAALLFLKRFNLSDDFFAYRIDRLRHITVPMMQKAVSEVLDIGKLLVCKVGRIS